jgi:hypothetical protein
MPNIIKNKPKPKKVVKKSPKLTALSPVSTKKTASAHSKIKHSPAEYYNCLLTYANQN